ncbi:rhombosortase [Sapientia aquatica]|uniref:rhombosortase n=1 Tax=Sapientia aquatica TaxID=1549640 RepID=UPI001404EBB5|nr:rhombosortase [Sapientia aquatica]
MLKSLPASVFLALACVALAIAPETYCATLEFDRRAILGGEFWRIWTGHLVHFSAQHAIIDISSMYLVSRTVESTTSRRYFLFFVFLSATFISLSLLIAFPELIIYRGSSGVLTAIGVYAGSVFWRESSSMKIVVTLVSGLAILKTWIDITNTQSVFSSLPVGVNIAWQAHLIGALLGLCLPKFISTGNRLSTLG